jgi:cell division protein FtsL
MSLATGQAPGVPRTAPRPQHPGLRAVAPAVRVRRLPFLLLTLAVIVAGVLGLVSLNVTVNQQSFQISRLQRDTRAAEARWTDLQAEVDRLKAPARIAAAAKAGHLVPAGRARVAAWPGSRWRGREVASPGAATSPAAPGAGLARGDDESGWTAGDPFPLKRYLAEP